MKQFLQACFAFAITARAQQYAEHDNHESIDSALSTKDIGLVQWKYFFDKYLESQTTTTPGSFDAEEHACWF